jgi:hypothetical protein
MNIFKKYLIVLLVLGLLMSGLESVRSFFMANVIQPIALVVWIVWRVIASVDQIVYWILLILACFIFVMRLIPTTGDDKLKAAYNYAYRSGNRVEYWKSLMTDAAPGKEDSVILHDSLKKLLVSAMQDTKESAPFDLEKAVTSKEIRLSLEAQHFLFPPQRSRRKPSSQWNGLLSAWLRRKIGRNENQDTKAIEEILGWIESEMEINNDR